MQANEGEWDVVVVGAGPAGSALARQLAQKSRVLVLDRVHSRGCACEDESRANLDARSFRPPWRIGESLPGAAAVLLRRLSLFERFLADAHAERGASVSVWDSETPVWFDTLRDPNGSGWHLDRTRFDAMLRDAASEAGVSFKSLRGRLQVLRKAGAWRLCDGGSNQQYTAGVLVDATGRSGALCRSLGMQRLAEDCLVCTHVLLPSLQDIDRCTRTCADADGWWYSVRIPSGKRVLAFHHDGDDSALRCLRDTKALLVRARRIPILKEVLPESIEPVKSHLQPAASVALDLRDIARCPGLYAVGDALLSFDPIASQGLFHALASAESAAHCIMRYLDGDVDAGRAYITEMQEVQKRYRENLAATYAGPKRYSESRFWARRRVHIVKSSGQM